MKAKRELTRCMITAVAAGLLLATPSQADAKPLKVFILAGQSNMEGHAKIETFDYIGDDPATATLLKEMRGADGQPRVCDNVWISYLTGSKNGKMTKEEADKAAKQFEDELISPAEQALWKRGASN